MHKQTKKGNLTSGISKSSSLPFFQTFPLLSCPDELGLFFSQSVMLGQKKGGSDPAQTERESERGRYGFGPSQVKQLTKLGSKEEAASSSHPQSTFCCCCDVGGYMKGSCKSSYARRGRKKYTRERQGSAAKEYSLSLSRSVVFKVNMV